MADPARALSVLSALQEAGVSLSIDDFGTGYSSMSYLKRLPVDELKIDRSFVTDMIAEGSDSVLVRSSIDLGHNLGLSVVAEGVEDQATASALADLGCDVLQGYHLARPMDAVSMTTWLANGPGGAPGGPADPGSLCRSTGDGRRARPAGLTRFEDRGSAVRSAGPRVGPVQGRAPRRRALP